MELSELHDASLGKIDIDWELRSCRVHVYLYQSKCCIFISDFTEISLPRLEPWGPSFSINEAHQMSDRLEIEMQSGDKLVFIGKIAIIKSVK